MNPNLKVALAGGVAIASLGAAIYFGYNAMGMGRTVRSASEATGDRGPGGGPPPPAGGEVERTASSIDPDSPQARQIQRQLDQARVYNASFEFPDNDQAGAVFGYGADDLALRAESDDALGTLGITSRRGLVEAYRVMLRPIIENDRDAFERALRDLGAPNPQGAMGLFDRLTTFLQGSRVALDHARLQSIDPADPMAMPRGMPNIPGLPEGAVAVPLMINVMETQDDTTGETTTIRQVNVPLDSVFPGVREAATNGARTMGVWAPAQLSGTKGGTADMGPTLYFVHDEASRAWVPLAVRVELVTEAASAALDAMRRQRPQPD